MEEKRVHFVHISSKAGGIEVLLPSIIKSMKQIRFFSFVIRPNITNNNVYKEMNQNETYGSNRNIVAYVKLFGYVMKNRHDIFHLYNVGPIFLIIIRLAGARNIVYSIHGTIYWKKKRQKTIRKILWKIAVNKSLIFTSNSEYSKNIFLTKIKSSNSIIVNYNPIDNVKFTPQNQKGNKSVHIIFSGRLVVGKNMYKWLEIAARIVSYDPMVFFSIYGDGPLRNDLNEYTKKLKLESNVSFLGYTKDIVKAYRDADLLLFLSEYESFGNVVVESILCGTPVVASNIPSISEIFKNFPDFLVNLDNDLESNVINKVKNIDKLKEQVPLAIEEFKVRFSMERHISTLQKIYSFFV